MQVEVQVELEVEVQVEVQAEVQVEVNVKVQVEVRIEAQGKAPHFPPNPSIRLQAYLVHGRLPLAADGSFWLTQSG